MMARQPLQIASNSVEDLRLSPQAGAWVHGRLRLESAAGAERLDPGRIFLALRPVEGEDEIPGGFVFGEGFSEMAHVAADGSFEWKGVPPGRYYVQLAGDMTGGADWFLKTVLAGGRDADETGISVNGGALAVDLLASANGGVIEGTVTDSKGQAVPNAVIAGVPEPRLRSRNDRYFKTVSDQSGHFMMRALPPGNYTLFAWENLDGEEYYNPEFLKRWQNQGIAVPVGERERKSMTLLSIPESEEQE